MDLEKTYDKLRWSFITDTLQRFRLLNNLTNLIMSCLTEISMSLICNRSICESFKPTRGIYQGCLLSPYIFVMCMKQLAWMIEEKVQERSWTPLWVSRRDISLSHLFDVDDLILMGEASIEQSRVMMDCLRMFSEASGEVINPDKSKLLFSKNTTRVVRHQISSECWIPMTADLGKYLGVPLVHGCKKKVISVDG